jgi:hypothetical protein
MERDKRFIQVNQLSSKPAGFRGFEAQQKDSFQ